MKIALSAFSLHSVVEEKKKEEEEEEEEERRRRMKAEMEPFLSFPKWRRLSIFSLSISPYNEASMDNCGRLSSFPRLSA